MTSSPWDLLMETIKSQGGLFTVRQATEAGFSPALLSYHVGTGQFLRPFRGVYRLAHYPTSEHEDLLVLWLASDHQGTFSHETALALHRLSDVLPSRAHISLPASWKRRTLPDLAERHYEAVPAEDRAWVGPLPVTSPLRTLRDCMAVLTAPELVAQAFDQVLARGLIAPQIVEQLRADAPPPYRRARP